MSKNIMIYGANGYTGELIAEYAIERGLKPILAGRNKPEIETLAKKLELDSRVFSLDFALNIENALKDIDIVIHCAGPFSATAEPMMNACIATKTHYTDITGEIAIFEMAQDKNLLAQEAGVVLCPGVGFDVIPTDCLASQLKDKLPDATHLQLGFDSGSGLSPGTAKTSVEGLGDGGKIRKDGHIIQVPLAHKCQTIDFGNGEKNAMTIPWGDVSTAYYSTGIPNIEVYIPISPKGASNIRKMNWFRWLFKLNFVQKQMKKKAAATSLGPNKEQRAKLRTFVWGKVTNANGDSVTGKIETCNGYELTYLGAVEVAQFLLSNDVNGGAFTPSKLINNQLVHQLAGVKETVFS
ncbi:MAG: saccharopine dehydrogenase family protein [Kangiellaceae bacterium]